MIRSDAHRLLFVHVQKTGGLTVEHYLLEQVEDAVRVGGLPGDRHATLTDALEAHPELKDHFTFGFVRNPWARLYSWYQMIQRRQKTAAEGNEFVQEKLRANPFWQAVLRDYPSFEAFVLQGPGDFERLRTPQVHYLTAPGKEADFIGRTETLDADLAHVCTTLGLTAPEALARRNAGPPADYRTAYTDEMRALVEEHFAEDIERFGYSFDSGD
jgi:hypothetical protein